MILETGSKVNLVLLDQPLDRWVDVPSGVAKNLPKRLQGGHLNELQNAEQNPSQNQIPSLSLNGRFPIE